MAKLIFLTVLLGIVCLSSSQKLSHAEALRRIQAVGVTTSSSGDCSDRNNPRCTSLEQIREITINGVVTLKGASGCALTVTGGTEVGHASGTYSHSNGYKVDYRLNNCLDNYVTTRFAHIGNRPGDGAAQYQSAAGNIYALEGNHWDVTYYNNS